MRTPHKDMIEKELKIRHDIAKKSIVIYLSLDFLLLLDDLLLFLALTDRNRRRFTDLDLDLDNDLLSRDRPLRFLDLSLECDLRLLEGDLTGV